MKKKALITTTAAVALVAVVGIGSTLAYFTDQKDAQNTVTFGHVEISLEEPDFSREHKDNLIDHVVPGQKIEKDPIITVDETSEIAYLRASIEIADENEKLTDDQKAALEENITFSSHWYKSTDGYYYYSRKVEPGSAIQLFKDVTIPETWGNEVADLTFTINVHAEAIQADSFKPAKDNNGHINGWFYSDGETPVEAETYEEQTQLPVVVDDNENQPQ